MFIMKNRLLPFLLIILLIISFCKKDNKSDCGVDCGKVMYGIYHANSSDNQKVDSILKVEINKVTTDLNPKPDISDQSGQLENLYILFTRLSSCNNISFYICCYSCIQTAPPQTEVAVFADSSGVQIQRIFDFYTWENNKLTFAGAHSSGQNCRY
jgi:hypothetical protein